MTFISYSQNFEDVMLMRALSKVKRGFYIDVGAAEPFADSVTAAFYKQGWRGINVEPMTGPFSRLQEVRPEDTNLQVALEEKPGTAKYFSVNGGNGISTGIAEFGKQYKESNWDVDLVPVVVSTLAEICEKHVGDNPIHFLKIDVEGKERAVLEGGDFCVYRPWIILIEATRPNSQTESHQEWEDLLQANKYRFVYFDGLNRFYIAAEKYDALADAFKVPPNWFDQFVKASEFDAVRAVEEERQQVVTLTAKLHELESAIATSSHSRDEAFAAWNLEKTAREEIEARLNATQLELQRQIDQGKAMAAVTADHVEVAPAEDVEALKRDSTELRHALDAVSLDMEKLKQELQMTQQRAQGTASELDKLKQELEVTQQRAEGTANELDKLSQEKRVVDAKLAATRKDHAALGAEVDAYYQESFESSRHIAWLTHERMRMSTEIQVILSNHRALSDTATHERTQLVAVAEQCRAESAQQLHTLQNLVNEEQQRREQEIRAIRRSTSWRVTSPLRWVRLAFMNKNQTAE
jgi:FkbM family methyltransferase